MTSKAKTKILYIITKSNFGGAQRYVFELATNLPREAYEVVVACGGNGVLVQKLKEHEIQTRTIKSFERDINLVKEAQSMFELFNLIRKEKPDIVHLNSSKAGGSGAFIARLLGVPHIIFTAHGWPFFERRSLLWRSVVWFFSWLTALLAHTVILVSNHDLDGTHMPFVKRKLKVVHTAVPEINFREREDARTALVGKEVRERHAHDTWVVSTSEHTPNKNLSLILEALRVHNAKNSKKLFLTLMSDGELRQELESYVRAHNLTDSVTFTGYVDEARTYLRAFDIFVLPSLKEGTPYGLLEAGSAGLLSIASNVGGIPEVIENEKTGILIDPTAPKELEDALGKYATNETARASLGNALKQEIVSDFGLAKMLEKTVALYNS